jgi:hypothetical protein
MHGESWIAEQQLFTSSTGVVALSPKTIEESLPTAQDRGEMIISNAFQRLKWSLLLLACLDSGVLNQGLKEVRVCPPVLDTSGHSSTLKELRLDTMLDGDISNKAQAMEFPSPRKQTDIHFLSPSMSSC